VFVWVTVCVFVCVCLCTFVRVFVCLFVSVPFVKRRALIGCIKLKILAYVYINGKRYWRMCTFMAEDIGVVYIHGKRYWLMCTFMAKDIGICVYSWQKILAYVYIHG
jgi:hypothetical protein